VLIIFWLLCVICAIIPFRSKILSALAEVRSPALPGLALFRGTASRLKVTADSGLSQFQGFLCSASFMLFLYLLHLCLVAGSRRSEPCKEIGQRCNRG
jgi:hypothetical protein